MCLETRLSSGSWQKKSQFETLEESIQYRRKLGITEASVPWGAWQVAPRPPASGTPPRQGLSTRTPAVGCRAGQREPPAGRGRRCSGCGRTRCQVEELVSTLLPDSGTKDAQRSGGQVHTCFR